MTRRRPALQAARHFLHRLASLLHLDDFGDLALDVLDDGQVAARGVDQKKAAIKLLNSHATGIRTGVKALFGPDSDEYQRVGGTRASEHK